MKNSIFRLGLSLWAVSTMLFILACSDDDEQSYGSFAIDQTDITLESSEAATAVVKITSPSNWKAEISANWLQFATGTQTYGTPCRALALTLTATTNREEAERTATITFTDLTGASKSLALTVKQPGHEPYNYAGENASAPDGMKSNAALLMTYMNTGWNMGNTMESTGADETSWGNPRITKAMIDALKAQGFNVVRFPVRWTPRSNEDMDIDPTCLARVKEVVDYAYSQGMYVILNSHHDRFYDRVVPGTLVETKEGILGKFAHLWTQIATTFKEYDEHLLFAGTNEVIYISQGNEIWDEPTDENLYLYMNDLNQTFINAVRATGGNNAWRTLVVQPWSCSPQLALKHFVKPEDSVADRLMLEFHYYQPWSFCQQGDNDSWGGNHYYWGAPYAQLPHATNTESDMLELFGNLKHQFVDKGLPVIMGEYGAVKHRKTTGNQGMGINFTLSEESRAYYLEFVVREAKNHGFAALFWDNNCIDTTGENFGLFDRNNGMKPYSEQAVAAIQKGAETGVYPF